MTSITHELTRKEYYDENNKLIAYSDSIFSNVIRLVNTKLPKNETPLSIKLLNRFSDNGRYVPPEYLEKLQSAHRNKY
jgi:hypothetical protein